VVAVCLTVCPSGLHAQRGWDVQGQAMALVRDSSWIGGGLGGGVRFGRGMRVAGTAGVGWAAPDGVAGRGEILVGYHLNPPRPEGIGVYAAAGAAAEVARGVWRGLIVALLGVEVRPWLGGGLFAEAGIGGGVRLVVGYRMIRMPRRR
jgi:hypothetical protein